MKKVLRRRHLADVLDGHVTLATKLGSIFWQTNEVEPVLKCVLENWNFWLNQIQGLAVECSGKLYFWLNHIQWLGVKSVLENWNFWLTQIQGLEAKGVLVNSYFWLAKNMSKCELTLGSIFKTWSYKYESLILFKNLLDFLR